MINHPLTVLGTVIGTFLIACAYAFAVPLGSSPDEPDHWRYAYAVHTGQDTSDGKVTVPRSLQGFPAACVNEDPEADAACVLEIRPDSRVAETTTHISSYPRLYYRLVGWPLTRWTGELGLIAARLLSALVSSLFWGVAMLPWTGPGAWLMRLAVLLTVTPSALFFSGSINPQGMEIAVFAALWSLSAAVFARLDAGYRSLPRWMQILWPLALVVAVNSRLLSAFYLAVALLTCWLWFRPPLARLLRDRRLILVAALVVAAVAARGAAIVAQSSSSGILGTGGTSSGIPYGDLVISAVWRVLDNPSEGIGMLGWLDTQIPSGATAIWFLMAGGVMFLALPHVRRRHCVALGALLGCLVATWIVLEPIMTDSLNVPFWQARYGFPLWMGVPVLLAAAFVGAPTGEPRVVALHRLGSATGMVVLHVLALGYLMIRYMWSAAWFGPIGDPRWLPYVPYWVVAATGIGGALLLAIPALLAAQAAPADTELSTPSLTSS